MTEDEERQHLDKSGDPRPVELEMIIKVDTAAREDDCVAPPRPPVMLDPDKRPEP